MGIYGCGIDIEDLKRFEKNIPKTDAPTHFMTLIFSPEEIENHKSVHNPLTIPIGFSCKESVFKALGMSWMNSPLSWKDIRLFFENNDMSGHRIELQGYALDLFNQNKLKGIQSSFDIHPDHVVFETILTS